MRKTLISVLLLLFLVPAMGQEPSQPYPSDPQGQIVDRAQVDVWTDKQIFFYAVLYNRDGQGYFDLYKGGPWKKIATQKVVFQDEAVEIPQPSVLQVEATDDSVIIYWHSFIGYQEGAVSLAYSYDRSTGKITMQWSD